MYKLFRKAVLPLAAAISIFYCSSAYAEKADDKVGNFLAGVLTAPFKIAHHTIDKVIEGNKNLPVFGTLNGAKGVFYGASDSVENLGRAFVGEEISIPEEYGDISSTMEESPGGRIVASGLGGGMIGAAIGAGGAAVNITHDVLSTGELAGMVGGATATEAGLEEIAKENK